MFILLLFIYFISVGMVYKILDNGDDYFAMIVSLFWPIWIALTIFIFLLIVVLVLAVLLLFV